MWLKMNKIMMWVIIVLIIMGGFFVVKPIAGNTTSDNVQKITLSFKNYNYYPKTITVEVGKPVEITLDNSVGGCYRDFRIQGLGVNYYSRTSSDTIKFTPTKKGTFEFACSMRMGYGTLKVV